ncbi:MAG TPA: MFS transporter [Kofleriaceae bacterium]|nr:MFS transporter [Kofleriaceae bacterium]
MELLDELYSGVFSVGAAAIQESFSVSHQGLVGALLLAPGLAGIAFEPVIFLLADRYSRRLFVAGGLAVMGLASAACALAPSSLMFTVAVSVSAVANSCGVELAQATLADAHAHDRARALARWTFFGAIGDVAAPVMVAGLALLGFGWRGGFAVMAVVLVAWSVLLARAPFPAPSAGGCDDGDDDGDDGDEDGPALSLWASMRTAVANRRLLGWLLATSLCDWLDEILVVLASVHLREHMGAGAIERSLIIGAYVCGSLVGLAGLERALVRFAAHRIVVVCAAACAVLFALWLVAPTLWLSGALLALVGVAAAPLYPLTMAQSYAALPGRSGAVHAAARVLTPLSLGAPWLLAWIADHAGTGAALATILVGPITITALAALVPSSDATGSDDRRASRRAGDGEPG